MKKQRFFLPLIARFLCPKQKKWYVSYFVSPPPKNRFLSFHYLIFVLPFCPSNSPSFFNNHIFRLSSPPLSFCPLYRFVSQTK